MRNSKNASGEYYDKNVIRSISILDVCELLGINVIQKGESHWCKIRNEDTASCKLYTNDVPHRFYDYGGDHAHGDVISLTMYVCNLEWKDALNYLGRSFGIVNEAQKHNNFNEELSLSDYKKIGLHGDMATKNFTFYIEHMSIERLTELSEKYKVSMNELRQYHPKVYEQILKSKSIPFVNDMRNDYYAEVFHTYLFLKAMNLEKAGFKVNVVADKFRKLIEALQSAEQIFIRATTNTSIDAMPVGEYDPDIDIKRIMSGEINPSIGKHDSFQMNALAKEQNCGLKSQPIDIDKFNLDLFEDYNYTAYVCGNENKIIVGYLDIDHSTFKAIFDKLNAKDQLTQKIINAEKRSNRQVPEIGDMQFRAGR